MKRKVAIITGTRAEWGLLSNIARELDSRNDVDVLVIATNMHLSQKYGHTIDEITRDGFSIAATVPMPDNDGSEMETAKSMGLCMTGMADVFSRLSPDVAVILGDRYEMLAAASAATIMRIPVIHISGGAISEGAIDDNIRHAITKLSALHLTETERYRQRVIQMGESPDNVINTGAIGVYNILNEQLLSKSELEQSIGISINEGTLLVTLHPATLDNTPTDRQCRELLDALDKFPKSNLIFTYPNNDANGCIIINMIEEYASRQPAGRAVVIPSLGKKRYLSALKYVSAVVGNSSSGIVEVPSTGIPTVDIGIRQRGRIAAQSVIHCDNNSASITHAISSALSPEMKEIARKVKNPYYQPNTLQLITEAIARTPLSTLQTKKFHDIING